MKKTKKRVPMIAKTALSPSTTRRTSVKDTLLTRRSKSAHAPFTAKKKRKVREITIKFFIVCPYCKNPQAKVSGWNGKRFWCNKCMVQ